MKGGRDLRVEGFGVWDDLIWTEKMRGGGFGSLDARLGQRRWF